MEGHTSKTGRKRILSDEERIENKRKKDLRRVQFYPPEGFKELLQNFAIKSKKDLGVLIVSMIEKNKDFIDYKNSVTN